MTLPFHKLNFDELTLILGFLSTDSYASFAQINKSCYSIVAETENWKKNKELLLRHKKRLHGHIINVIIIGIISLIVFIIVSFTFLYFSILVHTAPEHECQVSDCNLYIASYCAKQRRGCDEWEKGLFVKMFVTTHNSTLFTTEKYFPSSKYNETFVGSSCNVTKIENETNYIPSPKIATFKNSTMSVEMNAGAKVPCFYNDDNDYFFAISYSIIYRKLSVFLITISFFGLTVGMIFLSIPCCVFFGLIIEVGCF